MPDYTKSPLSGVSTPSNPADTLDYRRRAAQDLLDTSKAAGDGDMLNTIGTGIGGIVGGVIGGIYGGPGGAVAGAQAGAGAGGSTANLVSGKGGAGDALQGMFAPGMQMGDAMKKANPETKVDPVTGKKIPVDPKIDTSTTTVPSTVEV